MNFSILWSARTSAHDFGFLNHIIIDSVRLKEIYITDNIIYLAALGLFVP